MRISDWSSDVCSSDLLKVPFARCGDGVARHVSAVTSPRQGPFHCLGCGDVLTLRQPVNKRRHFAHRPDSLCTGETALHRYVKELLAATRTLTPPALVLEEERVRQLVFAAGTYARSDERRVGKECVRQCRSRVLPST